MSRLTRYLREHNAVWNNAWLYFLILGSRTCNAALVVAGLAMIVYAGDLYAVESGDGAAPAWPSGPPPATTVVFAAMGAAAVLSAAAALVATSRHSLFLLNIHLGLLALLLAAQVCLAAAVGTRNDHSAAESGTVIPDMGSADRSLRFRGGGGGGGGGVLALMLTRATASGGGVGGGGGGNSVRGDLSDALVSYKWADALTLAIEAVTLLVGCLLHSAYMRADQRAEDLEEGLLSDSAAPLLTARRREVLAQQQQQAAAGGRRAQLPPRVVRDDPWSRRMREQYGVDTSVLSYNPATPPPGAVAPSQGGAAAPPGDTTSHGRCIIS